MNTSSHSSLPPGTIRAFLWRHRWVFGIGLGLAAGLSVIFSSLRPTLYQAEALIYPPPFQDSALVLQNSRLGVEFHTERFLQIMDSRGTRDCIRAAVPDWNPSQESVEGIRTPRLSIRIVARAGSPAMATRLATALLQCTESRWQAVFHQSAQLGSMYIVDPPVAQPEPLSKQSLRSVGLAVLATALLLLSLLLWKERLWPPTS